MNFGAEGDRLAYDGVYWVEYPLSGSRESVKNQISSDGGRFYQNHSLLYPAGPVGWITASGAVGASKITIANARGRYTVKLLFAEPQREATVGQRVFDVRLNGKQVCKNLDVLAEAGKSRTLLVKEIKGVSLDKELVIEMAASKGKTLLCGVEMIKE